MNRVAVMLILAWAPLGAGCMTTRAQTPAEHPALEVPPVPPRILEPVGAGETPRPEPVEDLPPPPTSPARSRPPARESTREPVRTEPKPEAPPAETAQTPPPAAAPSNVPPLRIPGNADGEQAEKQVRDALSRADGLLNRVDYRRLSPGGQKAYDEAKLFMEGSTSALKESNFELARELAGKAEKLAKELQGR